MTSSPEAHCIDRTGWPAGPWDQEPDRLDWRHQGYPCLIVRTARGHLCGYVGLPPGHPGHGVGYMEAEAARPDLRVHGGLTYANACHAHICHTPLPGEPDDVWWLGFDCAHAGDAAPMRAPYEPDNRAGQYRTIEYVKREAEALAAQMRAWESE